MSVVTPTSVLSQEIVRGIISDFAPNGTPFSQYYNTGYKDKGVDLPLPYGIDVANYDVFNNSREVAEFSTQGRGTPQVQKQGISQRQAALLTANRYFDMKHVEYAYQRAPGKGFDSAMQSQFEIHQAMQLTHQMQRHALLHEWSFLSAISRPALYLKQQPNGSLDPLVDSTDANLTITFQLPAAHTGQLPLGAGGADLISAPWSTASTDIPQDIRNIIAVGPELSGTTPRVWWMNTTVANAMFNNTKMQAQGGSAFRVWDSVSETTTQATESQTVGGILKGMQKDVGYRKVSWRALGEDIEFLICDEGADVVDGSTGNRVFTKYVPDNKVICTPKPSKGIWWKKMVGTQMRDPEGNGNHRTLVGLDFLRYNHGGMGLDPAVRTEILDKFVYFPVIPKAIFVATVIYTP